MNTYSESRNAYSERRIIENRRRRELELKRHIFIVLLSVILFVVLILCFSSTKSIASENDNEELYKYYKSVMIQNGDSLWSLSEAYSENGFEDFKDYMDEIKFINNITEDTTLISGNYLIIPYYDVYNG